MKKIALILTVIVFSCISLRAQGGFEIGLHAEQSFYGDRQQQSYGVKVYVPVGDIFTVDWHLAVGPRLKGGFYAHTPAGLLPGAYILGQLGGVDRRFWNITGLILMALPEGMGIYANQEGRLRHHFALHPLGVDYWYRRNPYDELGKVTGSLEYRLKIIPIEGSGLFVSPTVAAAMIYNPDNRIDRWGFRFGLTIGYAEEW